MTDGNRNDLESTQGNDRRYLDASQRKPDFLHSGERWRLGAQGRFGSVRSRTQAVSGLAPLAAPGIGSGLPRFTLRDKTDDTKTNQRAIDRALPFGGF